MTLTGTAAPLTHIADPLWHRAAARIRADIVSGALAPGSRLPPERELCESLSISRVTLRRALLTLEQERVLTSSHGRGWFVTEAPRKEWLNSLESFSETAQRMGLVASSIVVRNEIVPATFDEAGELMVAPGSPVFHLERVRLLDSVPTAVDVSTIPAHLVPGFTALDFTRESLYTQLDRVGLALLRADSTIEASEADEPIAQHLRIAVGQPVLTMHQLVCDDDDRPVLSSAIRYAGDRYRLRTAFARPR